MTVIHEQVLPLAVNWFQPLRRHEGSADPRRAEEIYLNRTYHANTAGTNDEMRNELGHLTRDVASNIACYVSSVFRSHN